MIHLTSKQLRQAASIKEKIENLENELARLLTSTDSVGVTTTTKTPRKRRKMSAAARAKISAAAKARWAKVKAGKK